jgi:hypothetical protein
MCPTSLKLAAGLLTVEFWFGKTKRLRANSILEFLLIPALMIGAILIGVFHGRNRKSPPA